MALRLGKTTLSHFFSQVVISAAGFVSTFAIARVLGAEGVGAYALGVTLLTWFKIPVTGIATAQINRMSGSDDVGEYLVSALFSRFVLSLVLSSIALLFSGQINDYVGADVALFIVLILLTDVLFGTLGAAIQSQKRVAEYGWIRAVDRISRTIAQVGLILVGAGISGLFLGHLMASVIAAILSFALLSVRFSMPSITHFYSILSYAKYAWSGGMKGKTFGWTDTLILGLFVSNSLIGIYEVAWTLASFLMLVSNSISSTLFPEFSEIGAEEDYEQLHHYLNEAFVYTGVFLIPGLFGVVAIGDDLLRIYSPEFTKGSSILLVLIGARCLDAYGSQMVSTLRALDRPDLAFRIDSAFVVMNLLLNVVLIIKYGWYGAAVATFLSGSLTFILSHLSLTKLIGSPNIPYGVIGREILSGTIMFVVLVVLERSLASNHFVTLFLVFIGAAIYISVLHVLSYRIRQKTMALIR